MLDKIRLFLDRHGVLNWIVHFLVMSCGGVLIGYICFPHFNTSLSFLLFINLFVLFMGCWVNYIRPTTESRETDWWVLFDMLRWFQGFVMVLWATIGIYNKKGEEISPALWELERKEALDVLIIGIGLFLLWNVLYFLAKKYHWEWKKPLAEYGKSKMKKVKKVKKLKKG